VRRDLQSERQGFDTEEERMPKALRLHEYRGIDGLTLDELPLPHPERDEVRIKVDAFALNYGDFDLFENKYVFSLDLPARIGDECAGVVDAVGPDVKHFQPGERVSTLPWMNAGYGVDGDYALCPESFIARYPDCLTSAEVCSIWVQYLTAYFALLEVAELSSKDTVLITAASSSAGTAAMQIAHCVGATAVGTTRTRDNAAFLKDVGFDHVIVTDTQIIESEVMRCTGNIGARVIYDPIGGDFMQQYAGALAKHGQIFLYGGMSGQATVLPEITLTQKGACLRAFSVYSHIEDPEERQRGVDFVYRALEDRRLRPIVDRVFPLEAFREAFTYQYTAKNRRGKIVVAVDPDLTNAPGK
jgi:NADPH:quinone reductase-like Zn-dependent oxidoreductase